MISLVGVRQCLENLAMAARSAGADVEAGDLLGLRAGWLRYLGGRQPAATLPASPSPEFVEDPAHEAALLSLFIEPPVGDDLLEPITERTVLEALARRDDGYVRRRRAAFESALGGLRRLDPSWGLMADLVLTRLFCADVPKNVGGSTERALGVVWVNTPESAGPSDLLELLVHETTHHLLFLDHRCRGHYGPALDLRASVGRSAIRGTARPLPCVFDSLLVSLEILALRALLKGALEPPTIHPPTGVLFRSCLETIESLDGDPAALSALSARGRDLLERAREMLTGRGDPNAPVATGAGAT